MVRGGRQSQLEYLKAWRRNNRNAQWLYGRKRIAKALLANGGRVMILGVRVNWRNTLCESLSMPE
jgi:hypothetical protein